MEIKAGTQIETKGISQYVASQISGIFNESAALNPSLAYWIWEVSDTVGDAVNRISWAFEQLTPVLKDKITNDYIDDHPVNNLINNPGFKMSSDRFQFELMTSFLVTGECYPILEGNVDYEPFGLYVIPSNYTNLLRANDGWLGEIRMNAEYDQDTFYRQTIQKRKIWVYQTLNKLKETTQILNKSRRDNIRGQSPISMIYYQAMSKYYGLISNTSMLKRGSRPSGLYSPTEPLGQEGYEAFKNSIKDMEGAAQSGRNIVTNAPIKYDNLIISPRDMDFINLIENNRSEIYNVYQIPLPLVAMKTMTMNNYQNSIAAFYDLAVLPRAKFLYKQLGNFILGRYKDGDRYELVINEKELPALKERLFERAKKMRDVFAFSEDEIRSETGYESIGDEGNQIYKPANWIPAGDDDYTDDIIRRESNLEDEND